jgi:hypothetical protein
MPRTETARKPSPFFKEGVGGGAAVLTRQKKPQIKQARKKAGLFDNRF